MTDGQMFIAIWYGFVGFMTTLSILIFLWGFVTYLSRLGTVRRARGIEIMQHAVAMIAVVVLVIGVMQFVQKWLGL